MKFIYFILSVITFITTSSCSQEKTEKKVGGDCEICEAIYESPVPFEKLSPVDTLPDYQNKGPRLKVEGIIYKKDKTTLAKGVVLYIYHTDQSGVYPKKGNEKGYATQHGYLRGWVKTNDQGKYSFYTLRPASYPNSRIPAHIHAVIKEPDKNEYWIDDFLFDDDPFLTGNERQRQQNRGGNGIVKLSKLKDNYFLVKRDIVLGENIPAYP